MKSFITSLALAWFGPALAIAAENPRPNILFAFADDWGCHASAYAGIHGGKSLSAVVKTPNFDRIAREGALFTRAHVTAPSCTPCRSSLLSGQYFWRTGRGAILLGAQWDAKIPSYPLLLEAAGYHIGFTYKVWGPGSPPNAPYGGGANGYGKAGGDMNRFSQAVSKAGDPEAMKRRIFQQVADNFQQFLGDRKGAQPWCYWFGPTNVHRAFEKGSGLALWGIDPDSLKGKLPPFLPDNETVRADVSDYLGEVHAFDAALGVLLEKLESTGELDNTLVVVSGDHGMAGVPRGKCNLYDFGTHVALAARWPARVPGGRVADDFINLMDLAPTFLAAAGEMPPAVMTGRSFLDVLTSKASGQVDPTRSFVITGRERHVDDARDGFLPYPQRALRTADFLYIRNFAPDRWPMGRPEGSIDKAPAAGAPGSKAIENNTMAAYSDMDASPTKAWMIEHRDETGVREAFELGFAKRPAEELYDLGKDPDEMQNVAADPAYAAKKKELSEQLIAELKRTGDPRVTGDGAAYDNPPFTDPASPRRKAKAAK